MTTLLSFAGMLFLSSLFTLSCLFCQASLYENLKLSIFSVKIYGASAEETAYWKENIS